MSQKNNTNIKVGKYNKDEELYSDLVKKLYDKYPNGVTLPPEYADFIENNLMQVLIRLSRYKFITKMIKPTDRVLEIGCGSGLGTTFIAQHCSEVIGIDVKQHEIDEARRLQTRKNTSFEVEDFFDYKFKKPFDVVVNMDVIEHLSEKMGHKLVKKSSKAINLNGIYFCGTPSIYSYPYQGPLSQASHIKCYDMNELTSLADNYFGRTMCFSMNDEIVHTGHHKMAWYYLMMCLHPKI